MRHIARLVLTAALATVGLIAVGSAAGAQVPDPAALVTCLTESAPTAPEVAVPSEVPGLACVTAP
ncbi:hypothetical protein [Streptosporangium sp. KLBMP 9127]|nr:hypothetical protein [Streptosporangium sp. KLBMP 9127]